MGEVIIAPAMDANMSATIYDAAKQLVVKIVGEIYDGYSLLNRIVDLEHQSNNKQNDPWTVSDEVVQVF
jgi:hypothetical protein